MRNNNYKYKENNIKIKKLNTNIKDLFIIEPYLFKDNRGYFFESYNKKDLKNFGIDINFVQINESFSKHGVLRGLHFQKEFPQAKLVRVIRGQVYDVAVDLRRNSNTFLNYFGIILSEDNKKQMFIPKGFAHGFIVLSDVAIFQYYCSDYYHKEDERGIRWNDNTLNINWQFDNINKIILSEKDKKLPTIEELIRCNEI